MACQPPATGIVADDSLDPVLDRFDRYFGSVAHGEEVWVVGYGGKILHASAPSGPWEVQLPAAAGALFGIDTPDGRHLWAVGELGLMLHSRDGGSSWSNLESGIENENLLAVDFVDERHGFCVGEYGVFLRTRDGGATWETLPLDGDAILNDLQFFDQRTGIVVGEFGTFLRTEDGGETWAMPTDQFAAEETYLYGLSFRSPEAGFVSGLEGRVYETGDGGLTWREDRLGTDAPIYDVIHAPGGGPVIAVGDRGLLYRRNGDRWAPVTTGTFTYLRSLAFVDADRGLVVGGGGTLLRTRDAGRSWEPVVDGS